MTPAITAIREALTAGNAFPFQYDVPTGQVAFVTLAPETLNGAAFLDQRMLTQTTRSSAVSIEDFEAAASELPPQSPKIIFHQGHCGSTLLSRLIATASSTLALREPLVLRALATLFADVSLGDSVVSPLAAERRLTLFLRSFASGRAPAVVKASSICTDLALPLLAGNSDFRAIFMCLQPEAFIATTLAGPNNRVDMAAFAGIRRKRLRRHGVETPSLFSLSEGQLAALVWASEAVSFAAAPDQGRYMPLDFDRFLQAPESLLQIAGAHLGMPISEETARQVVSGPEMKRYSKAPQFEYSPGLRAQVLNEARRDHATEIRAGLNWLSDLAARSGAVSSALSRVSALRSA
ncbi:MAG: hypothetical protein U5J99_02120 [Parvularculaceae bacterium]|nr:hypothetical protein [Parvularculaceae bacterium]